MTNPETSNLIGNTMKSKTNNQNTQKTKPSAEDKALAELVRTKVIVFVHDMKKLCKDNELSFDISGWVEDPVDRGESPNKTLTFKCGRADVRAMLAHKIIDISAMLQNCINKCSYDEVTSLATMAENLVAYACKKVITNLNKKKMETDNKSKTKET